MNIKVNKNIFLKLTVLLIFLRSPVILLAILTYLIASKKAMVIFLSRMAPFIILMLMFVFYSFALGNNMGDIIGQTRDIILALTVAFFLVAAAKDIGTNRVCYNVAKVCFVIVAILKIILLSYSILTGTSLLLIIEQIQKIWDIQMMTLGTEGSAVGRIQIPIDSVVPYFLYFYAKEIFETKKSKVGLIFFGLLCFSMLLTYSRLIWAQSALFIFLSILVEMRMRAKVKLIISVLLISLVVIYLTPFGDTITAIVNSRVGGDSNKTNQASDLDRILQNAGLWAEVVKAPVFGHGLGYYIPTLVRSDSNRYLYESQTLSMLMDFGYIGVAIWVIMIVGFLIYIDNRRKIPLGSMLFLSFWALSGTYNPYLFGASGGLILYFCSQFNNINRMISPQIEADTEEKS